MRFWILLFLPFCLFSQYSMPSSSSPPPRQSSRSAPPPPKRVFKPSPVHVPERVQSFTQPPPAEGFVEVERTEIYSEPGIVGLREGKWVGSDHLFNLSPDLGLVVDIIAPEGKELPLKKEDIIASVDKLFTDGKLLTHLSFPAKKPATPFFNVLLMIYPIPQGFVAFVSCRLFEEATLKRADLSPGITWQVITWERQTLIVSNADDLKEVVEKSITELTQEFVQRFKHFQSLEH